MILRALAATALLACAATGMIPATPGHADPIPETSQMDARMRLAGIEPIDVDTVSREVCDTLHENPSEEGTKAALDALADNYAHPFARGYTLGVMADVRCADMVPLLRDVPTAKLGSPEAAEIASQAENTDAMSAWSAKVGVATTTGSLVGAGVGFVIGCALGGIATSPTLVFTPVGCLTAGVTGAGVGGVLGTLAVGGPTAVIAGVEMVQVLISPSAPA